MKLVITNYFKCPNKSYQRNTILSTLKYNTRQFFFVPSSEHSTEWLSASSLSSMGMTCTPPSWRWARRATWCGFSADFTSTPSSPSSSTWCSVCSSLSLLTPMRPSRSVQFASIQRHGNILRSRSSEEFFRSPLFIIVPWVSLYYILVLLQHHQQDNVPASQLKVFIAECRDQPDSGRYQTDGEPASCGFSPCSCCGWRVGISWDFLHVFSLNYTSVWWDCFFKLWFLLDSVNTTDVICLPGWVSCLFQYVYALITSFWMQ